jgi:hypothetical protein
VKDALEVAHMVLQALSEYAWLKHPVDWGVGFAFLRACHVEMRHACA